MLPQPTSLISDPVPVTSGLEPRRNRGVRCIRLVRRSHHQSLNWSILVRFCTRFVIFPSSTSATVGRNVIPKRRISSRSVDASRMDRSNFCVSSLFNSDALTVHTLAHEAENATMSVLAIQCSSLQISDPSLDKTQRRLTCQFAGRATNRIYPLNTRKEIRARL